MAYQFVGDLHGLPAMAMVDFEPLYSYTVMSGEVRSQNAQYVFTADIHADGGFGDMTDRLSGDMFRIQIQNLTEQGFVLTANPFEGMTSTSYVFQRSN